jgi:release factor glutamine methyltransferase
LPEAPAAAPTIASTLARATDRLREAGCETPRLDAEVLLAFALKVGRERLVLDGPNVSGADRFEELVARRVAREPVAYITGERWFRRIALKVDPRVLIPRPETELLVEVGLSLRTGARVVDVGTGSGAVALALADERRDLSVWATDAGADAVALARENAARLGLEVRFVQSDLLAGIDERFDAVLANLPYVADGTPLPPEIARYEPPAALFGGPDGLSLIRRLVAQAADSEVGLLALEVGFDQADAVASLVGAAGYRSVERLRDLAGIERVIVGRRR